MKVQKLQGSNARQDLRARTLNEKNNSTHARNGGKQASSVRPLNHRTYVAHMRISQDSANVYTILA